MEQLSLMHNLEQPTDRDPLQQHVEGLSYTDRFITAGEERRLVELLDNAPWSIELRRRVQHYGYRYDYRKRNLAPDDFIGALPAWAIVLGDRLVARGFFDARPDQVIVNEYMPGQGIASHTDRETCFGEQVASISLLSTVIMDFTKSGEAISIPLKPRSLVAMQGAARHTWRHGITARQNDRIDGIVVQRTRRISLTFRTVIDSARLP